MVGDHIDFEVYTSLHIIMIIALWFEKVTSKVHDCIDFRQIHTLLIVKMVILIIISIITLNAIM